MQIHSPDDGRPFPPRFAAARNHATGSAGNQHSGHNSSGTSGIIPGRPITGSSTPDDDKFGPSSDSLRKRRRTPASSTTKPEHLSLADTAHLCGCGVRRSELLVGITFRTIVRDLPGGGA
jgi:hypothetical protein